jgi:hypothetical protein
VDTALRVAKFLLGAAILVLAIIDTDTQPFILILSLVLMGVLTADELMDWLPHRNGKGHVPPE